MNITITKKKSKLITLGIFLLINIIALFLRRFFVITNHRLTIISLCAVLEVAIAFLLLFDIKLNNKFNRFLSIAFYVTAPIVSIFCVEYLQKSVLNITLKAFAVNYLIYLGVYVLFSLVATRIKYSVYICAPLFLLVGITNHYVIAFRGSPMQPWDIAAAKTAMNVIDNFIFTIDEYVLISILLTIFLILLAHLLRPVSKTAKEKNIRYIILGIILILCISIPSALIINNRGKFDRDIWNQTVSSKKNGYITNFLINLQLLDNKAPEGYSEDAVQTILSQYQSDETSLADKPNIIVIMNEAFADLTKLDDIGLSEDYMPFTHSMQTNENATTGELVVSVFGGGTCNTEYEFLTSNICPMLRTGSYPMQQFVSSDATSLASNLKDLGYKTIGIHPYYGSGWNRNRAYPLLGFDQFITIEDFSNTTEKIRGYISDKGCYDKIIDCIDTTDDPTFVFAVTMQNHGGYADQTVDIPDTLSFNNDEKFPQLKQYLELAKISDQALQQLVEHYKNQERKTIILYFGDHQPSLGNEYEKAFPGTTENNVSAVVNKYTVPFVLWTNFSTKGESVGRISTNYLAPLMLEKSNLPQTAYHKYLNDLRKEIPVLSSIACIDNKNMFFDLNSSEYLSKLNEYKCLQYNNVFDKNNLCIKKFSYEKKQ